MKIYISNVVAQRDIKRYGDFLKDTNLKNVWLSLENLQRDDRLAGLKTILGIGLSQTEGLLSSRIEAQVLQWPEIINNSSSLVNYR